MLLFTLTTSTILIGGFIIDSLRPKAQLRPIKKKARK